MQILNYRFRPRLIFTLITCVVIVIFVKMGLWQAGKADAKQDKLKLYEERSKDVLLISGQPIDMEFARYRRAQVRGEYRPDMQILLDNRTYKGRAGYHVLTPMQIAGTRQNILVNRGWVPLGDDRNQLPVIETPRGIVEITGLISEPSSRYLELGRQSEGTDGKWQVVWQNLDMTRYLAVSKLELLPAVVLLDPQPQAGGYVRDWPKPDLKIETNRGYALQWFLMAIAVLVIFVVTNLKKTE